MCRETPKSIINSILYNKTCYKIWIIKLDVKDFYLEASSNGNQTIELLFQGHRRYHHSFICTHHNIWKVQLLCVFFIICHGQCEVAWGSSRQHWCLTAVRFMIQTLSSLSLWSTYACFPPLVSPTIQNTNVSLISFSKLI